MSTLRIAAACCALVPAWGLAQDAATGRQIATQGAASGVAPCASCHGAGGEGNAAGGFPRIGGQHAGYLERQLAAYASGARENPVMTPIAKALNDEQRAAVAAYYATVDAPEGVPASGGAATPAGASGGAPAASAPTSAQTQRARTLYVRGDQKLRVQACANCHGPEAIGEAPFYPALAGQHRNYLESSLKSFKDGSRKSDPTGQMNAIASHLSEADITALSAWLAAQPPASGTQWMATVAAGNAPATSRHAGAGAEPRHGATSAGASTGTPASVGASSGAPMSAGSSSVAGGSTRARATADTAAPGGTGASAGAGGASSSGTGTAPPEVNAGRRSGTEQGSPTTAGGQGQSSAGSQGGQAAGSGSPARQPH